MKPWSRVCQSASGPSTVSSSKSSVKVGSGASSVETSVPIASSPSPDHHGELAGGVAGQGRVAVRVRLGLRDGLPAAVIGLGEQGDGRAFLDVGDGRVDDPRGVVGGLDVLAGRGELRQHPRLYVVAGAEVRHLGVGRRGGAGGRDEGHGDEAGQHAPGPSRGGAGLRVEVCGSFGESRRLVA